MNHNRFIRLNKFLDRLLDVFYDFLVQIAKQRGFGGDQKLLVNNTITSFDIAADTPYYNQGLFRNFADRVFFGSPQAVGPANRADRFSSHYEHLIQIANSKIDQNHPEIQPTLFGLRQDLAKATSDVTKLKISIDQQWKEIVTQKGLKATDPDYSLQYLGFLASVKYADQIKELLKEVDRILRQIDAVKRSIYATWEQTVLDNFDALSETSKESRPLQPTFERSMKAAGFALTDLSFAQPDYQVPSLFDVTPPLYPMGDLQAFLKNTGSRPFSISKSSSVNYKHDSQWSGGGSSRFSIFGVGFGGGGGGGGSSSFTSDVKKLNTIAGGFENITEVLIDRGGWFNPGVLQDKNVRKNLGPLPELERLQYVSVSMIIARGLTLSVTFDSTVDTNTWSKSNIEGSGGVSFLGFSFGASGGGSSTTTTVTSSGDKKTITFKDDLRLVRVLGYRVEPFLINTSPLLLDAIKSDDALAKAFDKFNAGELSYIELQKIRIGR